MGCIQVYDGMVKRLNQLLVAAFGVLLLAASAPAQIHAAPPSVTSIGFGGHPFSGIFTSVTSLGPRGYTPGFNPAFPNSRPFGLSTGFFNGGFRPHHRPHGPFGGGYGSVYAVPYFVYYDNSEGYDENYPPEEQYNGGPTVFDRRGPGAAARPPEEPAPEREPAPVAAPAAAAAEAEPPSEQPETILVFKDGHQLEIGNYAVVGDTLYDLTEGHRRKIALADLDLVATVNENENRGIDFQLPAGSQVN